MNGYDTLFERYDRYRVLLDRPVHQDDRGVWQVHRHDDVLRVVSDHETFSSVYPFGGADPANRRAFTRIIGEVGTNAADAFLGSMIRQDPPVHRKLRSLASQAFTPRRIAGLEPRITEIAGELLDAAGGAELDVVRDLASPLPVAVIAELLGLDPGRRAEASRWSRVFASLAVRPLEDDDVEALTAMQAYFGEVIERRRREPADDLVSALVQAELDGQRLDQTELLGFCYLLFSAGIETTTNLIGNAVLCLARHPDLLDRLRADRSLVPAAVEETLRYHAPVQVTVRLTRTAVRLGGVEIGPGERVHAWNGSANRDPRRFGDPDVFRLDRGQNPHTTFGRGIHFCLGAPLARMESRIALELLLDRLPARWRLVDKPVEQVSAFFLCGVTSLPVAR